jgi:hypothetical protein
MNRVSSFVRRLSVVWLSLFALVLAGCGSSPEGTVEKFYKAIADNRVEDAVAHFSIKDVKENDMTAVKGKLMMIVGEQYSKIQSKGGLDSIKTSLVQQEGDKAVVKAELKFKDGTSKEETVKLVKDGDWKIFLK